MFVLPEGVQDHAWLRCIVYGQGSTPIPLVLGQAPRLLHQFKEEEIKGISRITVSPQGKRPSWLGKKIIVS